MQLTGAQIVVRLLERQGITTVTGIPGGAAFAKHGADDPGTGGQFGGAGRHRVAFDHRSDDWREQGDIPRRRGHQSGAHPNNPTGGDAALQGHTEQHGDAGRVAGRDGRMEPERVKELLEGPSHAVDGEHIPRPLDRGRYDRESMPRQISRNDRKRAREHRSAGGPRVRAASGAVHEEQNGTISLLLIVPADAVEFEQSGMFPVRPVAWWL